MFLGLVVATLSIWHWRFIEAPGALPELRLASPLVGWKANPHHQYKVIENVGGPLLRLERENRSQSVPSIHVWFGENDGLEGLAAIHIRCEARWKHVETGPEDYMIARIVTMMKDTSGTIKHPLDFGITQGAGSKDWHACEAVFKITDDMDDFGIEISMLGTRGTLEVRDLSVVAVRHRNWVPAATVAVLAGWVFFVARLIRSRPSAPPWWRAVMTAFAVVGFSWIFVFPQTKGMLLPMIGQFAIGDSSLSQSTLPPLLEAPASAQAPASSLEPVPDGGKSAEILTPPSGPLGADPAEEVPQRKPAARDSSALHRALRTVDANLPLAHAGLFAGITILVLVLTGRGNQWTIPLALAVLAELVPELNDHLGGWDDLSDVLQNIAGVGIGIILWRQIPALRRLALFPERKSMAVDQTDASQSSRA